jgi:hypothetical protein
MAPQPATITVNFTPNYTGNHRVCYRIQGSGDPYTCTIVTAPATSYAIPITVDNETCDEITYEGYVQPLCQEEESEEGRIPFVVTFTPEPSCNLYTIAYTRVGENTPVTMYDCSGESDITINVEFTGTGFSINMCSPEPPPSSETYSVTLVEDRYCICECIEVEFEVEDEAPSERTVWYTNCDGQALSEVLAIGTYTRNVVANSYVYGSGITATIL